MRILLVEDEPKLLKACKRALELQHFIVDTAPDGETGLDLAIGEAYDLMILDWMLPKLEGVKICQKVRQAGITTPVLILTAKSQISDKVAGLDFGADDYMVKPFSFDELFARVRALSRRSIHIDRPTLTIADLSLDPQSLKVTRAKQNISLSAKEYAILEYLLRHQNAVITKKQIVDHVWGYDADVLESTIEVHIKHLRDKIDSGNQLKLIHTHRGFGYQISQNN